jgi:hypothetical protein
MDRAAAKDFFINKINFQANRVSAPLTDAEKYMLSWSESDPNFVPNQALTEQFEHETSENEFESKIVKLLLAAFAADVKNGMTPKERYREAYLELKKEDDYILVMVGAALGAKLKKFWFF